MTDSRQQVHEDPGSAASVSSSLLIRLQTHDGDAWKRLVRLFYPLVRHWCQRAGLQADDAADVSQEVFRALANNVVRFRREGGQNSFRAWLHGITRRQLLAHWRRQHRQPEGDGGTDALRRMTEVPEAIEDDPSAADAADERTELLRRAVALLKGEVEEATFQAFWRTAVDGHTPSDVAADLGLTVNAVYLAKARLLRRLRTEFGDLL